MHFSSAPNHNRDYDPYAWVAVYSVEDDDEMGLKEGEVSVIPSINLLRMSYKQDVDHVWELVDILSFAIGIGEIKAAVSIGRWVIAAIDILLSAGNMVARTFGHLMPEGWVAMWHEFSMVVGTFQLLNAGMAAVRNYKAILKNLKDGVMAVKNTLTAVAFSAMMRFMKLDEELLTLTETILTTRDMKWLNRLLDDLEKEKTAMGAERYNNIKKAAEDRLAVLEGEAQLEQKLAKERKAADELEGADAGARKKTLVVTHFPNSIASGLTGRMRSTYETLVNSGLRAVEEGGIIRFYSAENKLIAEMTNSQLVFKYSGFGGDIVMDMEKTTTVLGKWSEIPTDPNLGTRYFLGSNGEIKVVGLPDGSFSRGVMTKPNPNGMNFLDLPDAEYQAILNKHIQKYIDQGVHPVSAEKLGVIDGNNEFWELYNYPFLEDAFKRGDKIRLVSYPSKFKNNTFGRELDAIDGPGGLAEKYSYHYDSNTATYLKK